MSKSSRISGFFKKTIEERIQIVQEWAELDQTQVNLLKLTLEPLDGNYFIENVIGVMQIPLGVAVNFRVNEKDYLVPMAVEEASVVAAASNSAKITLEHGGFFSSNSGPIMIGQIQCVGIEDPFAAKFKIKLCCFPEKKKNESRKIKDFPEEKISQKKRFCPKNKKTKARRKKYNPEKKILSKK